MTQMVDVVLDVMRVPASGDPLVALRPVGGETAMRVECDVLVVGGGMGGVAAALAAARRGKNVRLLEETDWLGGQMTSQGVSALDEHEPSRGSAGHAPTMRYVRPSATTTEACCRSRRATGRSIRARAGCRGWPSSRGLRWLP